jgi:hypothetical protein
MKTAHGDPNDDWESRALRIVVTLDSAAEQLANLINEIRRQRDPEQEQPDDRPQP